jgi:hypothetical protein
MVKQIIGGVVTLVIGGTVYGVSQSNVVSNFAKNTGQSQQQAQQYVNNIKQSDLQSFSQIGQNLVTDGNTVLQDKASIDCVNYTYKWVTDSLTCYGGAMQLEAMGNDEIALGNCYQALDTNLGNSANSKITECISDSDTLENDYKLPIAAAVLDQNTITTMSNTTAYNKSVLQAALQSKQ